MRRTPRKKKIEEQHMPEQMTKRKYAEKRAVVSRRRDALGGEGSETEDTLWVLGWEKGPKFRLLGEPFLVP